jgi:hypothetical protein
VTRRPIEEDLQDFARLQVRAGLLSGEDARREVREAIAAEMPGVDADLLARAWLAGARKQLLAEQASWPAVTEHDRLAVVFEELQRAGVGVLQACEDHWAAKALLESRDDLRGVAWFVPSDVWHAIDEGMLEVNVWHASGANVAPGDELLDEVVAAFTRHGVGAHFDEGRIEVSAHWQRRIQ